MERGYRKYVEFAPNALRIQGKGKKRKSLKKSLLYKCSSAVFYMNCAGSSSGNHIVKTEQQVVLVSNRDDKLVIAPYLV